MLKFAIIFAVMAVCHGAPAEREKYWLFTRETVSSPTEIIFDTSGADPVIIGPFNTDLSIIILVHGLGGFRDDGFNSLVTRELFVEKAYNVIVLDWKEAASHSEANSAQRARTVGESFARFLDLLLRATPNTVTSAKLHIVGFGLGAHVAGIASRALLSANSLRIGRITGLDPSGSGWGSNSARLRDTDATYVEVIHTDGSGPFANGIGTPIGHVNFYANGGSNQPGCFTHACSHNRAWELFAASIRNENLVGYPCSTVSQLNLNLCRGKSLRMGGTTYITKPRDSLRYRANTRRSFPF